MALGRTYDFYSPFMAAWIVQNPDSPDGTRFPLWVDGVSPDRQRSLTPRSPDGSASSVAGDIDELSSLAFCTDISVELQLASIPKITATLSPPFREGRAFLNSSLIEWGNSIMEVQFGYTGGAPDDIVLSPVFSGILLKPEVTIGQDISIVLNAQGVGAFTSARQDAVKTYQNKTRREIIKDLAQFVGLEANFDAIDAEFEKQFQDAAREIFVQVGIPQFAVTSAALESIENTRKAIQKKSPMDQPITVSAGGLTIWRLLYQIVREAQCWMFVQGPNRPGDPEQLKVVPRNAVMTGKPKYTFTLFDYPDGQIGPADDTYPILSVSSPTSAVYLPSSTRGFLVFGYDSKERVRAVQQVDSNGTGTARTGNAQTQANATARNPAADPTKVQGMGIASSDSLLPETLEQINAEKDSAATAMGVQLELQSLGIPDILPAEVAAVRGIGARFEGGNYAIFKVTHKFGASGFTSDLDLRSNVGQLATTFDKETLPKDAINRNAPPTGAAPDGNVKTPKPPTSSSLGRSRK